MDDHGIQMGQLSVAVRKGAESMGRIFNMPFRPLDDASIIPTASTVEILERLPLLDSSIHEPPNGTVVMLGGVHILDPFSLIICKLHAFHTRPAIERGHDLDHLKILSTLLIDAEKLCRSKGVSLREDAERLHAILAAGEFPLPLASHESKWVNQAIDAAIQH